MSMVVRGGAPGSERMMWRATAVEKPIEATPIWRFIRQYHGIA